MTPTEYAIRNIAYTTANQATGKKKADALVHCKELGIDATAASFLESLPIKAVTETIEALQGVQQRNHPDTIMWQSASHKLQPLFAEMARRQEVGLLS